VVISPWGKDPVPVDRPISEMDMPKAQKMMILRSKCIQELITTEKDYVNDLLMTSKVSHFVLFVRTW